MKVVRHEKHRGRYAGMKTGLDGEYTCSAITSELPPAYNSGSNNPMCLLCPHCGSGLSNDNVIDPAMLGPEVLNELQKLGFFKEDSEYGPGCESDTTVIVIGNVWIINRNAACYRTPG